MGRGTLFEGAHHRCPESLHSLRRTIESRWVGPLPDQLGRWWRLDGQLRCQAADLVAGLRDLRIVLREIDGVPDVGAHILEADLGRSAVCEVGEDC